MKKGTVIVCDAAAGIIQLNNVRMVFARLWVPNVYQGKATGRQTAVFSFTRDEAQELKKAMDVALGVMRKVDPNVQRVSDATDNRFPSWEDKKTHEKSMQLKTSNSEAYPASYVDNKGFIVRNPSEAYEKHFYAGCRVNAKLQFTASPSNRSKGKVDLWSNLIAIQFAAHDTPIGGMSDEAITDGFGAVDVELPGGTPVQNETRIQDAPASAAPQSTQSNSAQVSGDDFFAEFES